MIMMDMSPIWIVLSFCIFANSQSTTQCGLCDCIYIEPYYTLDCENVGVHELPLLEYTIGKLVNKAYLDKNHIRFIDPEIIRSWYMLEFIDLTHNMLKCSEIEKIPENVKVRSDCPQLLGMYYFLLFQCRFYLS